MKHTLLCCAFLATGLALLPRVQAQSLGWQQIPFPDPAMAGTTFVVDMHVNVAGSLYALMYYGNLYRSDDKGQTWAPVHGPDGFALDYNDTDGLIVISSEAIQVSQDGGANWTDLTANLGQRPIWDYLRFDNTLFVSAADSFSETGGVYRSTDEGQTWELVFANVLVNELSRTAEGDILVSGNSQFLNGEVQPVAIHISGDMGTSWQESSFFAEHLNSLELWTAPNGTIFATGNMSEVFPGRTFRSLDGGASWTTTSMTDRINNYVYAPDGTLYAAALNSGVYVSSDNGASWTGRNAGLLDSRVFAMALHPDGTLFTSDFFSRCFSSTAPVVSSVAHSAPPLLHAGMPHANPARERVFLPVEMLREAIVTSGLCDTRGRQLLTVDHGPLAKGRHTLELPLAELAVGTYFWRVECGGAMLVRPVVKY